MPVQNKRRTKRLRNLIFISSLTAIVLSVSTYAWFVGLRTVNVSSFDIDIASADSLLLSLDGKTWGHTVEISSDTFDDPEVVYANHTNNWGGRGLIPMSSIGDMDTGASRMKLFEKASLTPSAGGYRLMASRVPNFGESATEQDGYVVFDLFVRNFSGTQYIEEENVDDEEAIYLTVDSSVTVAQGGVADTGIENSVRVAFAQIGRVAGTVNDDALITSISCTPEALSGITGLCRKAQIWEPNDAKHVANAISWYETSCLKRTDIDTFEGGCGTVIDGISYPTYAVKDAISSEQKVDVYDGGVFNSYTGSSAYLEPYDYFTDAEKLLRGTQRPQFMSLAPNSITKVRIYIYIEGQDIDNYDFASIGKRIAVKFGFTKERFTEDDINYEGENKDVNQGEGPGGTDRTAPVITLIAPEGEGQVASPIMLDFGATYEELGATATDNVDLDLTEDIVVSGKVNTQVAGTYTVIYTVVDQAGNTGTKTRTVIVNEEV